MTTIWILVCFILTADGEFDRAVPVDIPIESKEICEATGNGLLDVRLTRGETMVYRCESIEVKRVKRAPRGSMR